MVAAANEQGRRIGVLTAEQVDWFASSGAGGGSPRSPLRPCWSVERWTPCSRWRRTSPTIGLFATPAPTCRCSGSAAATAPAWPTRATSSGWFVVVVAWLDRWVKRDPTVDTGPRIDVIDQQGRRHVADDYPGVAGEPLIGRGSGTLELVAGGGSGPATIPPGKADVLAGVAGRLIPAPASRAIEVEVPVPADSLALGAPPTHPHLHGDCPAGDRPTRSSPNSSTRRAGW